MTHPTIPPVPERQGDGEGEQRTGAASAGGTTPGAARGSGAPASFAYFSTGRRTELPHSVQLPS